MQESTFYKQLLSRWQHLLECLAGKMSDSLEPLQPICLQSIASKPFGTNRYLASRSSLKSSAFPQFNSAVLCRSELCSPIVPGVCRCLGGNMLATDVRSERPDIGACIHTLTSGVACCTRIRCCLWNVRHVARLSPNCQSMQKDVRSRCTSSWQ